MKNAGHPSSVPVFIVGMQRSGTTLVEQIFASHSQVFGAGETEAFSHGNGRYWNETGGPAIFPEAILRMTNVDFYELGAQYVAKMMQLAPSASHIVDKMPANFRVAGLIHLALPNAVIIHTTRYRLIPVCPVFPNYSPKHRITIYNRLGAELGRYYRGYRKLMDHWRRVLPADRILDVSYEDVVADLEGQARRIIAHCGLDWDPRCLAFYEISGRFVPQALCRFANRSTPARSGRWRLYEKFLGPLRAELAEFA